MTTMLEKMGRAMFADLQRQAQFRDGPGVYGTYESFWVTDGFDMPDLARAALLAIRDPNLAVVNEVLAADPDSFAAVWRVHIDAILNEGETR